MLEEVVKKLNISIEFLKDKEPFRVDGFWLVPIDNNGISVNRTSNFAFKQNLTDEIVINDLKQLKLEFNHIKEKAIKFLHYIKDKDIQYCIYIDYGMGSEVVGKEKDGKVEIFL